MSHAAIGLAAGTGDDTLIPAPGAGLRLKITSLSVNSDGVNEILFKSGASGTFHIGNSDHGIDLSTIIRFTFSESFLCDEDAGFVINRSLSVAIGGIVAFETVKVSDVG